MNQLKIKFLHPDAKTPIYATEGSACFDLHCVKGGRVSVNRPLLLGTGLSFGIPPGHVMLVFSRSGMGFNQGVRLANSVGVIDSDYIGEVKVKLVQDFGSWDPVDIPPGARVAQAMIMPVERTSFVITEDLSHTERGSGGFGSTGQ